MVIVTGIPSKAEMLDILKGVGCKKTYKPYAEVDCGELMAIHLHTRKPPVIKDGIMTGCQITLWGTNQDQFQIWTSQKTKAMKIARDNKFSIRCFDGEAEIYIPGSKADGFLHSFGAKVKSNRKASPKAIEALKQYRANKAKNS